MARTWAELTFSEINIVQEINNAFNAQGQILYYDGTNVLALDPGTSGQVLTTQGAGADPIWSTNGAGDVVGPGSATDANIATFNGTTGKIIQDSGTAISDLVTAASSTTFTNKTFDANGTGNSISNIDVADLANGTDGELITWDATGAPATVAVGTSGQVLTSNGVGAAPTFQNAASGIGGSTGATDNAILRADGTGGSTVQASNITISDTDNIDGVNDLALDTVTADSTSGGVSIRNNAGTAVATFGAGGASSVTSSLADSLTISGQLGGVSSIDATTNTTIAGATMTLTNKTFDANGTGNSLSNVETADIASGSKSGSDATLVTGTAGTSGNLVQWDANGDAIDSSLATANVYSSGGTDVAVADGGTGRSSHTAYAVLCGGTTTTGAQQSIASVGTSGQILTSNGAGALPTFQDAAGGGGLTEVTSSTVSGSAVTSVQISSLDMVTDGGYYYVECRVLNSSDGTFSAKFNGDTSYTAYERNWYLAKATWTDQQSDGALATTIIVPETGATSAGMVIRGHIYLVDDDIISYWEHYTYGALYTKWTQTALSVQGSQTNVTQLDFTHSVSSGIKVGSVFTVYKLA